MKFFKLNIGIFFLVLLVSFFQTKAEELKKFVGPINDQSLKEIESLLK